jgi:hypothetical protein
MNQRQRLAQAMGRTAAGKWMSLVRKDTDLGACRAPGLMHSFRERLQYSRLSDG